MSQRDSRRSKKTYSFYRQRPVLVKVTDENGNVDIVDSNRYGRTYQSTHQGASVLTVERIREPLRLNTIVPNIGDSAGGTTVTLRGTGFTAGAEVAFGASSATQVQVLSDSVITCVSPTGSGTVAVAVTLLDTQTFVYSGGFAYSSGVVAPAIDSLNYDQGRLSGGGQSIVITGTDLSDASEVSIGGNSATITNNTSTSITFTLPSHTAGSVTVSVTTPGGTSNTLPFEYWDPTTLGATGWWHGSYGGEPWTGGTGGDLSQATGASEPAVGSAQGGFTPADFDGSDDYFEHADDFDTFISGPAGTVLVLFKAQSATATAVSAYDNPAFVSDTSWGFNFGYTDQGVEVGFYDGSWNFCPGVAASVDDWHIAKLRWDTVNIEHGVDSGAMTTTAQVTGGGFASIAGVKLNVGRAAISLPAYFDGDIIDLVLDNATISDADIVKYRKYCQQAYGVSV